MVLIVRYKENDAVIEKRFPYGSTVHETVNKTIGVMSPEGKVLDSIPADAFIDANEEK